MCLAKTAACPGAGYKSGLECAPFQKWGGVLFYGEGMEIVEHGLYLVKDEYFQRFPSKTWMWNKKEQRPHYYAVKIEDLLWMVPMSTKTEKYKEKISKVEGKHGKGNCVYYHTGVIAGIERAFIISGMLPVTPEYIAKTYDVNQKPYVVQDKRLNRQLRSKVIRYIRLLEQGELKDQNNILQIRQTLSK